MEKYKVLSAQEIEVFNGDEEKGRLFYYELDVYGNYLHFFDEEGDPITDMDLHAKLEILTEELRYEKTCDRAFSRINCFIGWE